MPQHPAQLHLKSNQCWGIHYFPGYIIISVIIIMWRGCSRSLCRRWVFWLIPAVQKKPPKPLKAPKRTPRGPALTATLFLPLKRPSALKTKRKPSSGRYLPSLCRGYAGLPSAAPPPRAAAPPLRLGRHEKNRSAPLAPRDTGNAGEETEKREDTPTKPPPIFLPSSGAHTAGGTRAG